MPPPPRAKTAVAEYRTWLEGTLENGTDDWALGRERYDELVGLRAFDGLDADAILQIGLEQLATNAEARVAAAREIDPIGRRARRSSTGSRRTTRPRSRRPSTPIAR